MNRKRAIFVAVGVCLVSIAGCGGNSKSTTITPNGVTLSSIKVTPGSALLAKGTMQQFVAIGTFNDNSTEDLTSAVTWSATVGTGAASISNASGSNGLATATSVGTVSIVASLNSINSNPVTVTVTASALASIAISPALQTINQGGTQQFTATGTFTDHTTQTITRSVTWSIANGSGSGTISSGGLVTGVGAGIVTVSATDASTMISGSTAAVITTAALQSITVGPATASVPKGSTEQYTAMGNFSDGSHLDLSSVVAWATAPGTGTATISNAAGSHGLATGTAQGTVSITASFNGQTSNAGALTVSAPALTSIAVTAPSVTVPNGSKLQLIATGTFTDQSTAPVTATWSVISGTGAANITSGGLLTGAAVGTITVKAQDTASRISGSTPLTITAIPASFLISSRNNVTAGDVTAGFTLNGMIAQDFFVAALDANGDVVNGPNGPALNVSIARGDGWMVNGPANAGSGTFSITPANKQGSSATFKVTATYSDSTCMQAGAVCVTTFEAKNHLPTLFVANCGEPCNLPDHDTALGSFNSHDRGVTTLGSIQVYLPPYTGMPAATITTTTNLPWALALDKNQNLFVSNLSSSHESRSVAIYRPPYTGNPTILEVDCNIIGLQIDSLGNLFASDSNGNVFEYAPPYTRLTRRIPSPAQTAVGPASLDGDDNLFIGGVNVISELSPLDYSTQIAHLDLPMPPLSSKVGPGDVIYFSSAGGGIAAPPYAGFVRTSTQRVLDVAFDQDGHEFAAEELTNHITEWDQSGGQVASAITNGISYRAEFLPITQLITLDAGNDLFSANNGFTANNVNGTVTIYAPPYKGTPITIANGITHPIAILLGP